MQQEYIRLCKSVHDFGTMVPRVILDNPTELSKHLYDPSSAWYRSLYYYPQDAKEYFDQHSGSIKGYEGQVYSNRLYWDFDNKLDVEVAKKDVLTLLYRLQNDGIDIANNVQIFFSGNKGFHVEVLLNAAVTPDDLKTICSNMAEGLTSFDDVIYNTNRIYRLPNTLHEASKLHKIEIDPNELEALTIQQIKERASGPVRLGFTPEPVANVAFLDKYKEVKKPVVKNVIVSDDDSGIRGLSEVDFNRCPKHVPRCIYALSHGIMQAGVGERNAIFLRLGRYYKNQGMNKEAVYGTLKGIARENARLYPEQDPFPKSELWNNIVEFVFNDDPKPGNWGTDPDNPLLEKYCNAIKHGPACNLHSKNNLQNSIIKIGDVSDSFRSFAENIDKNTVKTGIEFLDNHLRMMVGTTSLLVGATGSGKTTLGLNVMENTNKYGLHTMFFSLDMHKNLVYLKIAQKLTQYSQSQILEFYKTRNLEKIEEIRKAIAAAYDKTFFDFSAVLSLDEMKERVQTAEQKNGTKVKLVVVDYASRISGPYSDSYANARFNALKSTEVANDTDAAWLFINQVSRQNGDGSTPLRTKRVAKESGDWEESASGQVNVWRPFMGREGMDDVIRLFVAKNRMGQELERPLWWDGAKGTIKDMTYEEYMAYKQDKEAAEEAVQKGKFNFGA